MQYTWYVFTTCKLYDLLTNCKLMHGICVYFYKKCNDYLIIKFNILVTDEYLQMNHSKIAFC